MNKLIQFVLVLIIGILLHTTGIAQVTSPGVFYQGEVHDDGVPMDGTYTMHFEAFQTQTGGSPLSSGSVDVEIDNGLFQTHLPLNYGIFSGTMLWLEITITDQGGQEHTLTPRQPMGAAPYSMFAMDGLTGPSNGGDAPETFWEEAAAGSGISYQGGRVAIGTSSGSAKLDVRASASDRPFMVSSGDRTLIHSYPNNSLTIGQAVPGPDDGLAVWGETWLRDVVNVGTSSNTGELNVLGNAHVGNFASDHRLGVGTDNPWNTLHVVSNDGQGPFRVAVDNNQSGTAFRVYPHRGVAVGASFNDGDVPERGMRVYRELAVGMWPTASTSVCRSSNGTLGNCSSSERYKDGIQTLASASEILDQLRAVRFNWIESGQEDIGFVAEEIAEILPELVTRNDDGVVEGVEYSRITAVLAAAVQEQAAQSRRQLGVLGEENASLHERNEQLAARVEQLEQHAEQQQQLADRNAELEARLARLESALIGQAEVARVEQ